MHIFEFSFRRRVAIVCAALVAALAASFPVAALDLQRSTAYCGVPQVTAPKPPQAAAKRLQHSQVAAGSRDIAFAWLAAPTMRYPHRSLGSTEHAAAIHVQSHVSTGRVQELVYKLPLTRVFEDLILRLVDLDADGRDELVVVESDLLRGAAVVVLGLRPVTKPVAAAGQGEQLALVELARSPYAGSSFLWLNPLGFGDFDGDGKTDVAAVITPHIGGTLTLYRYQPPHLEPFAKAMDVSNHRMGAVEQDLGVVVPPKGPSQRTSIVVPDMTRRALHWLQWGPAGATSSKNQWNEMSDLMALPALVERMLPAPQGACLQMSDGAWWKLAL